MPSDNLNAMSSTAAEAPAQPTERSGQAQIRRPWHQPKLTQVALQVTGLNSGSVADQDGSTNLP